LNQSFSSVRFHHRLYELHLPVTDVDRAINFSVGKVGFGLGFGARGGPSTLLVYNDGRMHWMVSAAKVTLGPSG
jgi:hypothetical protein